MKILDDLARLIARRDLIKSVDADLRDWANGDLKFARAVGSRFHKLRGCDAEAKDIEALSNDGKRAEDLVETGKVQVFVIEHDWAAALAGAFDEPDAQVRVPYPECAFEFQVSGKRVIAISLLRRGDEAESLAIQIYVEVEFGWHCMLPGTYSNRLQKAVFDQVRAACVALDAEVAQAEIVIAPHRLNKARAGRGKLPLGDYHIVVPVKRGRSDRLEEESEGTTDERRRVRLHFRRGHWRHFETHKTWIKWTLVGDPDLGFIDKHYRL